MQSTLRIAILTVLILAVAALVLRVVFVLRNKRNALKKKLPHLIFCAIFLIFASSLLYFGFVPHYHLMMKLKTENLENSYTEILASLKGAGKGTYHFSVGGCKGSAEVFTGDTNPIFDVAYSGMSDTVGNIQYVVFTYTATRASDTFKREPEKIYLMGSDGGLVRISYDYEPSGDRKLLDVFIPSELLGAPTFDAASILASAEKTENDSTNAQKK